MNATGFQLLFLYFSAMFGSMLAGRYVARSIGLPAQYLDTLLNATTFVIAGILLVAVPAMRRAALSMLAKPVPTNQRTEVAVAALLKLAVHLMSADPKLRRGKRRKHRP